VYSKKVLPQGVPDYSYHYPTERTEFNIKESIAKRIYAKIKQVVDDAQKLSDLLTGLILLAARNSVLISPRELTMILQFVDDRRVTDCFMSLINKKKYLIANDLIFIIATLMHNERYAQQLAASQGDTESAKDENNDKPIITLMRYDTQYLLGLVASMINTCATIGDKNNFAGDILYRYFGDIARVATCDYYKQFCQAKDHKMFKYSAGEINYEYLGKLAAIVGGYLLETVTIIANVEMVPIDIRVLLHQIVTFSVEQSRAKPDVPTIEFQGQQIPQVVLPILAEVLVFGILGRFIMNYREKLGIDKEINMNEINNLLFNFTQPLTEPVNNTQILMFATDHFNIKASVNTLFSNEKLFYSEFEKLGLMKHLSSAIEELKVKQLSNDKKAVSNTSSQGDIEPLSNEYFIRLLNEPKWRDDWLELGKKCSQEKIKHRVKKDFVIPSEQAFILFVLVNTMFNKFDFASTIISFIFQTLQKPQLMATAAIRGSNEPSNNPIISKYIYNNVLKGPGNQSFANICLGLANVPEKDVKTYFFRDTSAAQSNLSEDNISKMEAARTIVFNAIFRNGTKLKEDNCRALAYALYETIRMNNEDLLGEVKRQIRMLAGSLEYEPKALYARIFYLYKIKRIEIRGIAVDNVDLVKLCDQHKYPELTEQFALIKADVDRTYESLGCWCDVYLQPQLPNENDLKKYYNTCILTKTATPMLTYVTKDGDCEYFGIDSDAFSELLENINNIKEFDEAKPLQETAKELLPQVWNLITSNQGRVQRTDKILRSGSDTMTVGSSAEISKESLNVSSTGASSGKPKIPKFEPPHSSDENSNSSSSDSPNNSPKSRKVLHFFGVGKPQPPAQSPNVSNKKPGPVRKRSIGDYR
jgi:hypothetical protein